MATGEMLNPVYEDRMLDTLASNVSGIGLGTKRRSSSDATTMTTEATVDDEATTSNRATTVRQQSNDGRTFRVLVAVDSCQWSTYAFDWYLKNVYQPDHEVICYHTMDRPAVHGDEYCVSVEAHDAVMKGCESNARDLHDEYMKKIEDNKMNGRVVVQFSVIGSGEAIVEAALKEKVQMVIVGSRGKGAVRRTLTGSVSDYVMRHAHCPVIVCCYERPRRRSSRLSSGSRSNSISEDAAAN